MKMDSVWLAFNFSDVGFNEASFSNALLHLTALNQKRSSGKRKTSNEIVIKMLTLFTHDICLALATMAMLELSTAEADRKYCTWHQRRCRISMLEEDA